jgi:hypothetical protein
MWGAFSKSCVNMAALRDGVRERQRREWRGSSGLGRALPRKVGRHGVLAAEAQPRHPRHYPTDASRYSSEKISGGLAFAGRPARQIDGKAAISSRRWKMSCKMVRYAVAPPSGAVQTMVFAVHFVFLSIFVAIRYTKGCWNASLGAAI